MKSLKLEILALLTVTAAAIAGCNPGPGLALQGTWTLAPSGDNGGATLTIDNDNMDFRSVVLRKNEDGSSTPSVGLHWKGFFGVDNQPEPADGKWMATMDIQEMSLEVLSPAVAAVFNQGKFCERTDWAVGTLQKLGGTKCVSLIGSLRLASHTLYTIVNVVNGKLLLGKSTPDHDGSEYDKRHVEFQETQFVKN